MLDKIKIRPALETDAAELSSLICENVNTILAPYYTPIQLDVFMVYYSTAAILKKIQTQAVFCAELEGEIIATVALEKDFVTGFYTRITYLNQGIGKFLMDYLEQFALEQGLEQLQLAASPVGVLFYTKHGWRKVEELMLFYHGVGFEETLMRKDLGQ